MVKRRRPATTGGDADDARHLPICVGIQATRFTLVILKKQRTSRSAAAIDSRAFFSGSPPIDPLMSSKSTTLRANVCPTQHEPQPPRRMNALCLNERQRAKSQHMHRAGTHLRRGGAWWSDRQAEVAPLIVSRKARIRSLHSKTRAGTGSSGGIKQRSKNPPKSHSCVTLLARRIELQAKTDGLKQHAKGKAPGRSRWRKSRRPTPQIQPGSARCSRSWISP